MSSLHGNCGRVNRRRPPDRIPHTYDGHSFTLHGQVDIDITFGDTVMNTPVYIKLDAQLLLSEGDCHQLGILTSIERWRGGSRRGGEGGKGKDRLG